MTPFVIGLISLLSLVTIIVIYSYASTPTVTPVAYTPPATTSNQVSSDAWCQDGIYCNGQGIPKSEAGVGVFVCGTDKVQYRCVANPNAPTGGSWSRLGTNCTPDMLSKC